MNDSALTDRGDISAVTREARSDGLLPLIGGALGARVSVCDAEGRVVARRTVGSQMLTGCNGPDVVSLAIRHPAAYRLSVRFSDGTTRTWPVDLTGTRRVVIDAEHTDSKEVSGQ